MNNVKLRRTIGLVSATSIGLGAMLGAGIFVFPGLAGGNAGAAATISFFIGGIIALLVAVCTAELATAMPQSGGGYFFISRAFGKFWGTTVGIVQWVGLVFASAFYLVSFGEYLLTFSDELNITWNMGTKALSFGFTLILLAINIIGTKKVGQFQNLMVISLTIMLVLIFSYGIIDILRLESKSLPVSQIAPKGVQSIFTTTALIFTSYLGFVQIANIGAEIKQPNKNLPRSLIWSVIIAMSLYIFVMAVCTVSFPHDELKRFGETATIEVARSILGKWGAVIVLLAGVLAALSSANASITSASRGVFALSKDKLINKKASKINMRFGTPHIALILVTLPIAVMLVKSKLEVFAEVASFLHLIIYAGICLSVLKLRATNPAWYVPTYRTPFAKLIAILGAAFCLALVFFMQKTSILISIGVLILAIVYYFFFVRKKKIDISAPELPHIQVDLLHPRILIPVDINREEKDLPHNILEAIPISRLLILGFKDTPEQTHAEQSEEEFGDDGKKKLSAIVDKLQDTEIDFDLKFVFSNNVTSQIKQLIQEEELQFILTLKPLSELNQIVVPIYDSSQINTELSTIIYNIHSSKPSKIKALFFTEEENESSNKIQLKQALENQLSLVNITINRSEIYPKEKKLSQVLTKTMSKKTDLIVFPESKPNEWKHFLKIMLEQESANIVSPVIWVLKH